MFDFIADGLTITLSILFPIYASHKALSTADPALLHPWLIYWVCLAILTTTTSLLSPFRLFVPFFAWLRLGLHLYLLLPGEQQGATYIYRTHVDPWLKEHDQEIEHFISTGHDRIKTAGLDYLKKLVGFVKAQLLGVQDESAKANVRSSSGSNTASTSTSTSAQRHSQPLQQAGQSYAQSLLARFSQPSARFTVPPPPTSSAAVGGGFGGIDGAPSGAALYGLLASALQAATAAKLASSPSTSRETPTTTPFATPSLNNPTDRAQYAEGLRALLKAFEKQGPAVDKEGSGHVPGSGTATPPPAGFEAIEHADAAISEAEKEREKPGLGKRKSTGGSWGGWMWGASKGETNVKDVGEEAGKGEVK